MTVNFGTSAQATAVTSFAPSRAIPPASYSLPTMKPGDVLQEDERDLALAARARRSARPSPPTRAKRTPLFARIADRIALDPGEAADERLAVERLELVEARAVDDAGDQLARVDLLAEVGRDQAVELGRVGGGLLGSATDPRAGPCRRRLQVADDLAHERERVLVRGRVVVGDARSWRAWTSAPPSSSAVTSWPVAAFTSGGPPMKIVPVPRDDDRLVAHRGHVGAAGRAGAHHGGDLRDALRRHPRLVVEDPPEVVAVGEDLVLQRQERAARVDEVDARQPVLLGDLLRAQVLLDRHREVRAALDRRVVGDDHALAALDDADPGDDPCAGRLAVVELPGGERRELQERRVRVEQPVDRAPVRSASRASGAARALSRPRHGRPAPFARAARRRAPPCEPGARRRRQRPRLAS